MPLFLCLSLLTGCAAAGAAAQSVPKAAGDVSIPVLDADSHPDTSYAAFAAELLRQSRTEGENTLLSPLSVMLALGMTANEASGETLAGFRSLFGMDLDALNAYCASALSTYSKLGGSTQATLVNSLWCDPDLTLEDRFVARCQQNYEMCIRDREVARISMPISARPRAIPTISPLSSSLTVMMTRPPRLGTFILAPLKAFSRAWGKDLSLIHI